MIHCLYHGSYADFDVNVDGEDLKSAHQLHAIMYALGDKYDINLLSRRAEWSFGALATELRQGLRGLIESIPIVYSSTPDSNRTLRDMTVSKVKANPSDLLHEEMKAYFQKALIEVPDFNWDLQQSWISMM